MKQYLTFTDEVRHALDNNLPVVALETTIISHGMPYPQNIEMAKEVEQIIRDNGAVPKNDRDYGRKNQDRAVGK